MDKMRRELLAKQLLAKSSAPETEVLILVHDHALSRFTHQSIHQNLLSNTVSVRVRVIDNGRCGVATTSSFTPKALDDVLDRAQRLAAYAPRDESWPGLPAVSSASPSVVNGVLSSADAASSAFAQATADAEPHVRAALADEVFTISERYDQWSAGFVSTAYQGVTVANSHGILRSFDGTEALLNVKQNAVDATGYAEGCVTEISALHGTSIGEIAAQKARAAQAPIEVQPGEWTVILEPVAFGELLSYLTGHFSAQHIEDGVSFLSWAAFGEKVFDERLTIRDDWAHPAAPGMPFDYEGVERQRLMLIEQGVARNAVTDSRWAARLDRPNTGHALPAPNADGPMPLSLTVDPGAETLEELIAGSKRALLISRFWYIRPVDYRQSIVTGMTRDGTYLIENGTIVSGVRNLRFNQSIVAALQNVHLSQQAVRTTGLNYTMVVPAARCEAFTFTSTTSF